MFRLLLISSKSTSLRKPNSTSSFTVSNSHTNLCDSTSSTLFRQSSSHISSNPSASPTNHCNFIYPTKTPNGYSFSCRLGRSFSSFSSQIGFGKVFSSGYRLNYENFRSCEENGCGFLRFQGFLGGLRSFASESDRESMEYDVVIVGAGPAGLSAAIRLKQLCREKGVDLSVCVVEKGAEVGAHILSGNVFEPRALDELLPQWKQEEAPISVPVSSDKFLFLTKNRAISLPCPFDNKGNYVISLSQLVRWMGMKAEELGVEIYPGFAASEILYDANDKVIGIATNDMGVAKDGSKKENYQRGVELKGISLSLSHTHTHTHTQTRHTQTHYIKYLRRKSWPPSSACMAHMLLLDVGIAILELLVGIICAGLSLRVATTTQKILKDRAVSKAALLGAYLAGTITVITSRHLLAF